MERAVLLSGHGVSPRAYSERHVERATALASVLGAADNATDTVTSTLRAASAEALLRACDDVSHSSLNLHATHCFGRHTLRITAHHHQIEHWLAVTLVACVDSRVCAPWASRCRLPSGGPARTPLSCCRRTPRASYASL